MEPTGVKRKLAVILAADVEGYSRLMGAASTGRTHGSTRPVCNNVNLTLANREPSTHGYMRTQ